MPRKINKLIDQLKFNQPKARLNLLSALVLLLFVACSTQTQLSPERLEFRDARYAMGSLLFVEANLNSEKQIPGIQQCISLVHTLEDKLSNYLSDSEISLLNRSNPDPFTVSPEVYELLEKSKLLARKTRGLFDPSIKPLYDRWKRASQENKLPQKKELEYLKSFIGMERLALLPSFKVKKPDAKFEIDTGGIGKGFAVDKIADCFSSQGVKSALINFGTSSIRAIGKDHLSRPWQIKIKISEDTKPTTIQLEDLSLSVSRAKGERYRIGGKDFGHIIDPRTGEPLEQDLGAFAIAESATEAEALSKEKLIERNRR